jgi:ASC-1-like (ASCH) protein
VRPGRGVELRRGYSDREAALWGEIVDVVEADSIENFFKLVHWLSVLPESGSLDEAIREARRILNIASDEEAPVLGFKVELTSR